jgi:DUF917 family protein
MRTLSVKDIEHFLYAAKVFGCGGGGSEQAARSLIGEIYRSGLHIKLVDPSELSKDALLFIVGLVGGGVEREYAEKVKHLKETDTHPELTAFRMMCDYLGRRPTALVAPELGPLNSVLPMYVAAINGIPVVDGDPCGRSKPEIAISTTHVAGIASTPIVAANRYGDRIILAAAVDDYRAEDLIRHFALLSGGRVGVARTPMSGQDVNYSIIPGTFTKAIRVGREVEEARAKGEDPVSALVRAAGAYLVFEGEVLDFAREERGAFTWGDITLAGTSDFRERKMRIWYKNEYLISYLDGEPYVTCPDILSVVDGETGEGLTPWEEDFRPGRKVAVIAAPCHEIWRTPRGLEIFGPRHFGFEINYRPVEIIVRG